MTALKEGRAVPLIICPQNARRSDPENTPISPNVSYTS
jgi:hypothetical protein